MPVTEGNSNDIKDGKVPKRPGLFDYVLGKVFQIESSQKIIQDYQQYMNPAGQEMTDMPETDADSDEIIRAQNDRLIRRMSLRAQEKAFEEKLDRFPKESGMYQTGREVQKSMTDLIDSVSAAEISFNVQKQNSLQLHVAKLVCYEMFTQSTNLSGTSDREKAFSKLDASLKNQSDTLNSVAKSLCKNEVFLDMLPPMSPDSIYELLSTDGIKKISQKCMKQQLWHTASGKQSPDLAAGDTLQVQSTQQNEPQIEEPKIEAPFISGSK